jgi:hypothetical protein
MNDAETTQGSPSSGSPTSQAARKASRERSIQPGPRSTLLLWWILIDVAIATTAVFWGLLEWNRARIALSFALFGAALVLVLLDAWRVVFLNRVRTLVSRGRIEQADIVRVRKRRFSMKPRADAPSPTGGWPIVPACEVSYVFERRNGARPVRGAFVVSMRESDMFVPGEDIEVFVDRTNPRRLVPSLVSRWYYRVSSRVLGDAADDPDWDFTNPPPAEKQRSQDRWR